MNYKVLLSLLVMVAGWFLIGFGYTTTCSYNICSYLFILGILVFIAGIVLFIREAKR